MSGAEARPIPRGAKPTKKRGLTPCQKLLLILGAMVGGAVVLYVLTVIYPNTESKYRRSERSILRPIVGESNPVLERHLADAAENMENADRAKAKLERALKVIFCDRLSLPWKGGLRCYAADGDQACPNSAAFGRSSKRQNAPVSRARKRVTRH